MRRERTTYERQHDAIRRFLEEVGEIGGGNPHAVIGSCSMALLSALSQMHRGNVESVARNVESLAAEIVERLRDGALELGKRPH